MQGCHLIPNAGADVWLLTLLDISKPNQAATGSLSMSVMRDEWTTDRATPMQRLESMSNSQHAVHR